MTVNSPIWHPCSQMKDYEAFQPLRIKRARGSYIELESGEQIIDAISSWWCKSLGHAHPRLRQALENQMNKFEHVIFANTTHDCIIELSERLASLTQTLKKVFYAGDGSCAVEIALKMSVHARVITGETQRTKFIALKNGYHGETTGALSVSDLGIYCAPYQSMCFDTYFISNIPYVNGVDDPLWMDCSSVWEKVEKELAPFCDAATALIVEPILQGAGGMQIIAQDFFRRLRAWSLKNNVHLIADEIMTGVGRTGKMLAIEHANIEPDFLCLSKGLTSGWIPFSAVLTRNDIYDTFYDDYEKGKSFLHSHTFSGNALGASVALEVLNVMRDEDMCDAANKMGAHMLQLMQSIATETGLLQNVRGIGAVVAADLVVTSEQKRAGFAMYQKAIKLGALLRPLGNTIYWLPPLNTDHATIIKLFDVTRRSLISA